MAKRLVELHGQDSDHSVRFTNGYIYPDDTKGFVNGENFVHLGSNYAMCGRRLSEMEFEQLSREVLSALKSSANS